MTKIKTIDVLKVIAAGSIIVGTEIIPSLAMILVNTVKLWKEVNKSDLGKIIKRLEKQEMLAIREKGNKVSIEITEKGKNRLLQYDFENLERKSKKRDGKWRLIVFDVPESKKKNRDAFRKKLLQIGCIRLQDSVFVNAFPCKDEVDFLCHYLEISGFVTLLVIAKIERGEQLIFKKYRDWDNNTL